MKLVRPRTRRSAFTLLEVILVMTIIALLMGGAIFYLKPKEMSDWAKKVRASTDLQVIETQLLVHEAKTGRRLTQEEGLARLVETGSLKRIPKDPFRNEYQYEVPGDRSGEHADVYTRFADLEDPSDDIGNWNAHEFQD